MAGIDDQIRELQEELERTPYNKATSKHIGRIKAKIARLRDEAVSRAMKSAGGGEGFTVKKSGDATVVLVGFPSTGKSTLLNKLTGTNSEVGAYAFTTLTVVPGALEHKGAKIQILDIPGLIAGAAMGKGRGKEVIGVVRGADFIVVLVDVFNEAHVDVLLREPLRRRDPGQHAPARHHDQEDGRGRRPGPRRGRPRPRPRRDPVDPEREQADERGRADPRQLDPGRV